MAYRVLHSCGHLPHRDLIYCIFLSISWDSCSSCYINYYCGCVQQTAAAWRNVFFIAAGVYVFGTIFYLIFGSGQRQPWAAPPQQPTKDEEDDAEGLKDTSA